MSEAGGHIVSGEVAGVVKRTRGWSWLGGLRIASLTLGLQIRVLMRLATSFELADGRAVVWMLGTRGGDVEHRGGALVARGARDT